MTIVRRVPPEKNLNILIQLFSQNIRLQSMLHHQNVGSFAGLQIKLWLTGP